MRVRLPHRGQLRRRNPAELIDPRVEPAGLAGTQTGIVAALHPLRDHLTAVAAGLARELIEVMHGLNGAANRPTRTKVRDNDERGLVAPRLRMVARQQGIPRRARIRPGVPADDAPDR